MIDLKFEVKSISYLSFSTLSFFSFFYLSRKIDFSNSVQIKYLTFTYLFLTLITFIFINFGEKNSYFIQNMNLFIFYFQYIYAAYSLFFLKKVYISGSEFYVLSSLSIFILLIYTINKNYENNKFIIIQSVLFYALTNNGFLGLLIIYLYLKYKFNFSFSKKEKIIFRTLPLLMFLLRALYATSEIFNNYWLSLIRKPFSGLSRFYDMQLVLSLFECNNLGITGSNIFYGSYTECQKPYSPFFEIFSLKYDLKITTLFLYILIAILMTIGYFLLIKINKDKEIFIILFLLSPPVNFLFYQGNLDLLPLVSTVFIFSNFNNRQYLKIFFLFLLSIIEIHPIGLIIGLVIYYLKNKDIKLLGYSFTWLLLFIAYLFFDFNKNKFSNNFLYNFTNNESYISDIYSSFGLRLDLNYLANFLNINVFFLIVFFIVASQIILINKRFSLNNLHINENVLFPFIAWMALAIVVDNPSYRLSIYFLMFVLIFNQSNLINFLIIFSIFLNPTPALDLANSLEINFLSSFDVFNQKFFISNSFFKTVDLLFVFLNRISLYFLFLILLSQLLSKFLKLKNKKSNLYSNEN